MATSWRNKKNYPLGAGTLNTTITSSSLTIVLDASQGANFPSASFTISIDEEIILIDSRSTDTLTVNASGRGYDGSTAAAHAAGTTIANYQIAKDFTDIETAVNGIENGTTTLVKVITSGGATNTHTVDDAGTNTVVSVLELYHTSSNTPASGLGAKVLLGAENSTGTATSAAELQGYLSTVTAGAEVGVFKLQVRVAGALQDALQVSGGTNSATIGSNQTTVTLWNTTATAVNAFGVATAVSMCGAMGGTGTFTVFGASAAQGVFQIGDGTVTQTRILRLNIANAAGNQAHIAFSWASTRKWLLYNTGGTDNLRLYSDTNAADQVTFGTTGVTLALDLAVNGGDITSTQSTFNIASSSTTVTLGSQDADTTFTMGRVRIYSSVTDVATFSHYDFTTDANYALKQNASGDTIVNAASGRSVFFSTNNTSYATLTANTLTLADATNIVTNATTGTKIGTATTQKIGFWNATPVVQYSTTGTATGYTGAGGTALTHTDTFTGNSGTKAYTIGDIVLALKTAGIMAAS